MAVCPADISGYGKSQRYADKLLAYYDLLVTLPSKKGQENHYFE